MAARIRGYYFLNANIWLERLLDRERNDEVKQLLAGVDGFRLSISDFSLHFIGVVLSKYHQQDAFLKFTNDLFFEGDVGFFKLQPSAIPAVVEAQNRFNLDFDDAYQYEIARSDHLQMVSFDTDFDRTDITRKTPIEV